MHGRFEYGGQRQALEGALKMTLREPLKELSGIFWPFASPSDVILCCAHRFRYESKLSFSVFMDHNLNGWLHLSLNSFFLTIFSPISRENMNLLFLVFQEVNFNEISHFIVLFTIKFSLSFYLNLFITLDEVNHLINVKFMIFS